MALKKFELYSSLWQSCDELRGGMDASQYKDYVLVLLFVKYVSDRYAGQPFAAITVPEGASFADMVKLKGLTDIGDQINKKILGPLAQANNLADMPDFNDPSKLGSGKEMVDRLTNLINIFENPALDFSRNRADGDDLLGDAYEYLMRHFATESGKSKGQFYTPAEVSRVIAHIIGIRRAKPTANTTVHDPACGSGSLLLKVADEAAQGTDLRVTLYGQEKDASTANLARMNMILHDYATAEIKPGNTLANPLFTKGAGLKTFDYVVANPPFSDKRWSTGLDPEHDPYGRFSAYGVPPAKQGDYAYLLHILRSMKPTGQGCCILPHGVLFRGNAEGAIRRNLVQRGYIKGIIGLPANLFYGTGIPTCIVVLDKAGAAARKGIFMIDASKGFRKDGPKNRLREQDIHKIVDIFTRQVELPGYSRLVPVAEIADARNGYNLNLPRYIDTSEPEDIQDIGGHLQGGIPERDIAALERFWADIRGVRNALFESAGRPGYVQLRVPITEIKRSIFGHAEFSAFTATVMQVFDTWRQAAAPHLKAFDKGGHPKALIETVSESLLEAFRAAPLLDAYDVYQHLMDYADETLRDDAWRIAEDGWIEAARARLIIEDKAKKTKARPDFAIGRKKYEAALIPPALLIARYFAKAQAAVEALEASLAALAQQMEEMAEEQGGEGGLLEEAKTDKDKLTRASVAARLKEIRTDREAAEERQALQAYLVLIEQEAETGAKLKAAQDALMEKVLAKYGSLTEDEVRALVVDDKWLATLEAAVHGELDRVSQALTGRVRQFAERYAAPLPQLVEEVDILAARVQNHIARMWTETERAADAPPWATRRLGDYVTFLRNGVNARADLQQRGTVRYIHYGDIHTITEIYLCPDNLPFLAAEKATNLERLRDGDLIFADASEDIAGVSKSVELKGIVDTEVVSGLHTIAARFDDSILADGFKGLLQFYRPFVTHLRRLAAGTKVYATNRSHVASAEIPLPTLHEQKAIAGILSDIDAYIDALERRGEKVGAVKQAIMQELLTGRTRLA